MNKQQFLRTLRQELSKLPMEEIVEATEYFEECFADATEGLDEEARLAEGRPNQQKAFTNRWKI